MSCQPTWSQDREKPRIAEKFPNRATAGHVAELELVVTHLPGEVVLPAGLTLSSDGPEGQELTAAHFRLPDAHSLVGARVERSEQSGQATTTVRIPFIPLPPQPGRVELTLPALPVSIARASGKLEELCTTPHALVVEDALASNPSAVLRADPDAGPQIEVWTAARDASLAVLAALPVLLLLLWALKKLLPRLKKPPVAKKPLPPWETALLALSAIDAEGLLERGEVETHFDRVSDTLREYLGSRYGFDGLESTTRESLRLLGDKANKFEFEREVRTILQRADLVKFARRLPEVEECKDAIEQSRRIVQKTTPAPTLDPRAAPPAAEGVRS